MQYLIYSIIQSNWFIGIYDAFRDFFVVNSDLPGDEICYFLSWLFTIGFLWLGFSLIIRVISFIFRGRL